jgi:hypothetical protein
VSSLRTGDHLNDISVSGGGTSVFLNRGHGTFIAAAEYTVPVYAAALATGELNRDGKPDLAIVALESRRRHVRCCSDLPDRRLALCGQAVVFPAGAGPYSMVSA